VNAGAILAPAESVLCLVVGHETLVCLDLVLDHAGVENWHVRRNADATIVSIPLAEPAQRAHLVAVLGQHLNKALHPSYVLSADDRGPRSPVPRA
jgi:hypothetical protein